MKRVFYRVRGWDDKTRFIEIDGPVNIERDLEASEVAERCAHDFYWSEHPYTDGWPLDFQLLGEENGDVVSIWAVDVEDTPKFFAEKAE